MSEVQGWHEGTNGAGLAAGRHVCMVFDDDDVYREVASGFLADGDALREKTVVFGPVDSPLRAALASMSTMAADPWVDFLGGRRLDVETMSSMFREQTRVARSEGYRGLRVAADMAWLLPARPQPRDIVAFETSLDRVVPEVDATVLCAYRRESFDPAAIMGTLCVHPSHIAHDAKPPFKLVAGDRERWLLAGAVDVGSAEHLAAALPATVGPSAWVLDLADLDFVDVAGMRAIAEAANAAQRPLELRGARRPVRRYWQLAGFAEAAPEVRFTH